MFGVVSVCIAVLVLLAVIFLCARLTKSRIETMLLKLPGPDYNFLFGNASQLLGDREDMFANNQMLMKPYFEKGICRMWIGSTPRIILLKAETAEAVLSSTRFLDKSPDYRFLHPWLGTGLVTSTGAKWHARRKLITPTFHFRILEDFVHVFNEQASILVSLLNGHIGKEPFDIYPYFTRCALDIICETAMGKSVNAQRETKSDYVTAVLKVSEIQQFRAQSPFLHSDILFWLSSHGRRERKYLNTLHGFTNKIIQEKREKIRRGKSSVNSQTNAVVFGQKPRLAFLDLLLQSTVSGQALTNEDVREEVDTFMFAGHDSTATSVTWTLYNIGRLPEVQRLVHEELDRIIGQTRRPVTSEEARKLKYLECVIKESLRIVPIIPIFSRHVLEDVDIGGYTIPAGAIAVVNVPSIHMDPKHFPDPEKFDPGRFLPENSSGRHPYAYVPFSAGPRNCIGQKFAILEVKVVLAHVLRQFNVTSVQNIENMKMLHDLLLRPANGLWLKLKNRMQ